MLSAESGTLLCVALVSPQHLMKKVTFGKKTYRETIQKTFVETECLWTPTRSWAPAVPVRIQRAAELRTRHRAELLSFITFLILKFDVKLSKIPSANLASKIEPKWGTTLENQGQGGGYPIRLLG